MRMPYPLLQDLIYALQPRHWGLLPALQRPHRRLRVRLLHLVQRLPDRTQLDHERAQRPRAVSQRQCLPEHPAEDRLVRGQLLRDDLIARVRACRRGGGDVGDRERDGGEVCAGGVPAEESPEMRFALEDLGERSVERFADELNPWDVFRENGGREDVGTGRG